MRARADNPSFTQMQIELVIRSTNRIAKKKRAEEEVFFPPKMQNLVVFFDFWGRKSQIGGFTFDLSRIDVDNFSPNFVSSHLQKHVFFCRSKTKTLDSRHGRYYAGGPHSGEKYGVGNHSPFANIRIRHS